MGNQAVAACQINYSATPEVPSDPLCHLPCLVKLFSRQRLGPAYRPCNFIKKGLFGK